MSATPDCLPGVDKHCASFGHFLQFHISKGPEAQRTPLPVKLVLPDHSSLVQRLELIASPLEGTEFRFEQTEGNVNVTDPFGQQFEVLAPSDDDTFTRGIKDIMLPCAPGTAAAIGAFYEKFYKVWLSRQYCVAVCKRGRRLLAQQSLVSHQHELS